MISPALANRIADTIVEARQDEEAEARRLLRDVGWADMGPAQRAFAVSALGPDLSGCSRTPGRKDADDLIAGCPITFATS